VASPAPRVLVIHAQEDVEMAAEVAEALQPGTA
jgi:hypothetical protein